MQKNKESILCIIGLGYVGLPLAYEFSKVKNVIGFDINKDRIQSLIKNEDETFMLSKQQLQGAPIKFTSKPAEIKKANIYIVTVPTPVDNANQPDLKFLETATETVSRYLSKGDIIVFESTVYPGATEEICIPILERSNLKYNIDFFCGYSPERINPGDNVNTLRTIKKIVSGSNQKTLNTLKNLYSLVVDAGIHTVKSIKSAEAAKVIENSQRDLNIAFVNELSKIFNLMEIDTEEVLNAAGTKWNFLKFEPGLVGGHCIGVDPYYLTYKAETLGYHPEIILAGRRINDNMHLYVKNKILENLIKKKVDLQNISILFLGIAFKENVNDVRNSKIIDLINSFIPLGFKIFHSDPYVGKYPIKGSNNIPYSSILTSNKRFDVIVLATPHDILMENLLKIKKLLKNKKSLFFDIKGRSKGLKTNEKI